MNAGVQGDRLSPLLCCLFLWSRHWHWTHVALLRCLPVVFPTVPLRQPAFSSPRCPLHRLPVSHQTRTLLLTDIRHWAWPRYWWAVPWPTCACFWAIATQRVEKCSRRSPEFVSMRRWDFSYCDIYAVNFAFFERLSVICLDGFSCKSVYSRSYAVKLFSKCVQYWGRYIFVKYSANIDPVNLIKRMVVTV